MKKHELRYLPSAERDIAEAIEYLMQEEPSAALIFLDAIDHAALQISEFPETGPLSRDKRLAAKGYRITIAGSYIMIYTIRDNIVWVLRVLHSKRNYPALLL